MKVTRKERPESSGEPRHGTEGYVAWGPHPFAPPDEADGARVAGLRMIRGPDGQLYAVADPPPARKP